ncbi:unnamed protein product [Prunus armeniaca]|uniref:Uncharacterized protein n=1 Tax=Prunus armeniaca TaxID=36596 RepID=A0A6J5UXJ0_PRUAR|nr:unnamed protein product [Prunus armeniaca]
MAFRNPLLAMEASTGHPRPAAVVSRPPGDLGRDARPGAGVAQTAGPGVAPATARDPLPRARSARCRPGPSRGPALPRAPARATRRPPGAARRRQGARPSRASSAATRCRRQRRDCRPPRAGGGPRERGKGAGKRPGDAGARRPLRPEAPRPRPDGARLRSAALAPTHERVPHAPLPPTVRCPSAPTVFRAKLGLRRTRAAPY